MWKVPAVYKRPRKAFVTTRLIIDTVFSATKRLIVDTVFSVFIKGHRIKLGVLTLCDWRFVFHSRIVTQEKSSKSDGSREIIWLFLQVSLRDGYSFEKRWSLGLRMCSTDRLSAQNLLYFGFGPWASAAFVDNSICTGDFHLIRQYLCVYSGRPYRTGAQSVSNPRQDRSDPKPTCFFCKILKVS